MKLNSSQLRAVSCGSGPCLVLAGPGSGKTTVIIRRIQHIIDTFHIRPENILAVTFSRSAAGEMATRFGQSDVTFSTLHGICLKILKDENPSIKVISARQQYAFLRSEIERYRLPFESIDTLCREYALKISRLKSAPENACAADTDMTILRIFSDYCLFMNEQGLLDFDDMISECRKLFMRCPDVLSKWQHRFRYILIDEFQDISPFQYDIICQLAGDAANIFAVGDDDQSIYAFRGADGNVMQRFLDDHPDARLITLDINYRCPKMIQSAAEGVISGCGRRFEKSVLPFKEGGTFTISSFDERREEYSSMIADIRKIRSVSKSKTVAVLFRTNDDGTLFSKMLSEAGISFAGKNADSSGYAAYSFPVQDIKAYLNIAANLKSSTPCREDILRIINRPERYIHRDSLRFSGNLSVHACLESMKHFYNSSRMAEVIEKFEEDLIFISALPLPTAIKYIRFAVGYDKWLSEYSDENHMDFHRLLAGIEYFQDGKTCTAQGDDIFCSILTMHAAKGMEFDIVFLPDSNEGVIPAKRSLKDAIPDEERRLYYVAMTRAREALHISWVKQLHNKTAYPSRFIGDIISSQQRR